MSSVDDLRYGKAVQKLANAWHARGYVDADERKAAYLAERERGYVAMCAKYTALGLTPPPPTILSGECP